MSKKLPHILLVEDNEGDVILIEEAFEECNFQSQLSVARNGQEALDFLYQKNSFEDATKPDLILLDINLPRFNGHEILHDVKSNPDLKRIPVIMLTTSINETDINKAYENHCNAYISKPLEMEDFINAIIRTTEFWFNIATLPK